MARTAILLFLSFVLATPTIESIAQDSVAENGIFAAAEAMAKRLDSFPEPNRSGWKQYLAWDQWGEPLLRGQLPDKELVQAILPKFYGFHEGLDEASFVRMRAELKSYVQGTDSPVAIGALPSFLLRIDKSVIDSRLNKKARTQHQHEETGNWIAGAWVTGEADFEGNVNAHVVPYQDQAAIEVRLKGQLLSPHTVAHSGRFQVHGSAVSRVEGVAYVFWEKGGLRATSPLLSVQTHSEVTGVNGPFPFRRIALRQAQKRQAQGEAEGAAIVNESVTQEFQKELAMEVAKVNEKLSDYEKSITLLKRLDVVPSEVTTAMVKDKLELGMRFSDSGADALPLREGGGERAFEIALHETFISAFPRKFLNGAWWSAEDFHRLQKDLSGAKSDETLLSTASHGWGARWDWREPVVTTISPEAIECELRFSQARMNDQWVKGGIAVSARFKPRTTEGKIDFQRISDVEVRARKQDSVLSTEEIAFYKSQFTFVCGDAIPLDRLSPPVGIGITALSLFSTSEVTLEKGWINLYFKKAEAKLPAILTSRK